jgi:trehalose-phosphatase
VKTTLRNEVDRLLFARGSGCPLVLLFDYDGTLVPIVAHPHLATLSEETRRLLQQLAGRPRLAVGVLSGRRLEELKGLVGLPGLCYCGTSGLELELDGALIVHPQAAVARDLVEKAVAAVQDRITAYPGAWVENKRLGLTVHYRDVAQEQIGPLASHVRSILQPFAEQLRILDTARAIEITPAFGWTKATAVQRIVTHYGPNAVPLYAGDEANDADALEAAASLGGVALGIGPQAPSAARHRLSDPAELFDFLSGFLVALVQQEI